MQIQSPNSKEDNHSGYGKPIYMPQLDGLRAIAIVSVLMHHFLPEEFCLNKIFHVGPLGVRLFFVISGFLITGILFKCKNDLKLSPKNARFILKRFYTRRFLRLFPIYYLAILVACIVAFEQIKPSLIWHLLYASNLYFSIHSYDALTAHFWSLAVEEQFYLIWPFIIIFTPQKHLLKVLILFVILGPTSRFLFVVLGITDGNREYIFTTTCFDSLGLGAILSYQNFYKPKLQWLSKYFVPFCFITGGSLFFLSFVRPNMLNDTASITLSTTFVSIFFVGIVGYAAQGFSGVIGVFLEAKPIVALGKISYGVYIYHLLIAYLLPKLFNWMGLAYPSSIWLSFLLKVLVTILVSIFSWDYFEKPINSMKQHFEYKQITINPL